jgi:hypothetical protein
MNPRLGGDVYLDTPVGAGASPLPAPAPPSDGGGGGGGAGSGDAQIGDGTGDAARALMAAMGERLLRAETRSDVHLTLPAPPPQQITIQIPPAEPQIEVRNEITVQPSPAPHVTVTPTLPAPVVHVAAPAVTIAPQIAVTAELPRATRIEIERDAIGNVLAVTQK